MVKKVIAYDDNVELLNQFNNIFYTLRQEFQLEATFTDAAQVLVHLDQYKPDVVLMDIQMLKDDDGLVALYQIKQQAKDTKVLMLTMFENNDNVLNAICLSADGYMLKSEFSTRDIPHEAMRKSLRVIFEGGAYLTPTIAKKILSLFSDESLMDKIVKVKARFKDILSARSSGKVNADYKLTKTQLIVLEKIVQAKSTEEIAAEMGVTENTVNTHIKAIFRELEVHSRAKAIRKAIEEKIVDLKAN
jgi:DNA-binding NarL/FixJ family response regulator